MNTNDIRQRLEAEYDVPFVVLCTYEAGEPYYTIGPQNNAKELFTIKVSFRNKVRLYMDFQPEKYSAPFIQAMSEQPAENRNRFLAYVKLLENLGAKTEIRINGASISSISVDNWPSEWHSLQIYTTKMPVFENGEDYPDEAYKWGSIMIGMILSLADIVPVEDERILSTEGYAEGDVQRIETNRYERNPLNRKLCLAAKGYDCIVCGMNFEKKYGNIGYHYIHVHHVIPVSNLGSGYVINPLTDLVPVCPNCHAMLHKKNPPILPDELRQQIQHLIEE